MTLTIEDHNAMLFYRAMLVQLPKSGDVTMRWNRARALWEFDWRDGRCGWYEAFTSYDMEAWVADPELCAAANAERMRLDIEKMLVEKGGK